MDDPREPLRLIPGKKESDFKNRKAYLNARASAAGYKNYAAWLRARRTSSVPKRNEARKGVTKRREKVFVDKRNQETSRVMVWPVTNANYLSVGIEATEYLRTLHPETRLRVFMQANVRANGSPTLSEHDARVSTWPYVSTSWMEAEMILDYLSGGETVVDWMRTGYGVEDITRKNGTLKRYGVKTFQILTVDP